MPQFVDTSLKEPRATVLIPGARVSARYFDVFGVRAGQGRTFLDGEDQAGRDRVVILTHGLWQTQFGGAADIIEAQLRDAIEKGVRGDALALVEALDRGGGQAHLDARLRQRVSDEHEAVVDDRVGDAAPGSPGAT